MIDSIMLSKKSKYFNELVRLTKTIEKDHNINALCSALFSSLPMGLDNVNSDFDAFILVKDISKCERLVPNIQIYYDKMFKLIYYNYNGVMFFDHKINDSKIAFDVCINDNIIVNSANENYKCENYPSYHNISLEEHLNESGKAFCFQERSSRIFIQRMLIYRSIWDKENFIHDNWNEIQRKYLKTLEIMDMWYTTSQGHVDFTLEKEKIQLRKYLNMMNSLMAMKWIMQYNTLPPILFTEVLNICDNIMVKNEVMRLFVLHKNQKEFKNKVHIDNIPFIKEYYLKELYDVRKFMEKLCKTNPLLYLQV